MNVLDGYESFVKDINVELEMMGIESHDLAMLDHLCYRVETDTRYRDLFETIGKAALMIGEAEVGGRPIATFEFEEPLQADGWRIPYLELPAPKEGSPYREGLEHAEFVVIGSVEKFATRHQELNFDRKGMGKILNPELVLKTDKLSVKFHEQPIGAVVRIEQRLQTKEEN